MADELIVETDTTGDCIQIAPYTGAAFINATSVQNWLQANFPSVYVGSETPLQNMERLREHLLDLSKDLNKYISFCNAYLAFKPYSTS